ncbi:formate dehydrogenase subunit gamma [Microvirga terricola]|uniref:Formate dehydrogenase subunit gamma n=1 Tax=Microvirga terricola TaxID=2719797 RepID=A0ABX0VCB4_9HYPH|nr:formate dehydrogenase subunit gamma [Microvirga terricola]NIX77485.1 formate dehydrogenase subunit gamma [Microvirga terricola]
MEPEDVEPGDAIHPGRPVVVDRYRGAARINHWVTATCLILLAISGLSLFHPSLFFLTALFGGGQVTRAIHPWIGVVLFFSFAGLFFRFWRANLPTRTDAVWLSQASDLLAGHEERMPEVGKYNAGQKFIFWSMTVLILILIASGLLIWEQYFTWVTTIPQNRVLVLTHSLAAVVIICVWIIHVYAAFWVRGTLRAMVKGNVTGGWAWRHHRRWLRELVSVRKVSP